MRRLLFFINVFVDFTIAWTRLNYEYRDIIREITITIVMLIRK